MSLWFRVVGRFRVFRAAKDRLRAGSRKNAAWARHSNIALQAYVGDDFSAVSRMTPCCHGAMQVSP